MEERKPSLLHRLNTFRKSITVEPVALLMVAGSLLGSTTSQTLNLEKACRVNLNLSEAICDAIRSQDTDDNADNERVVQEYVANLLAFKSIITSVLPCIILVFAGGWMDVTGRRKVMMVLPITGELLVQMNNIFNVIFFYQLKVEYLIFNEAVLGSICGGWSILFLAVFSYIMDITTNENRTYRLGLVSFCLNIGMPIGVSLSGVLLNNFGYLTVYILAFSMAFINACYTIFTLSDPERTKEQKMHDNQGFVYFMKTFFSVTHLLNSFKVILKKTKENRAVVLCVLMGTLCLLIGPMYGEIAIKYMSTRFRFGWDELQYSMFQTYNMILNIIASMFAILFLSKKLGWHDSILGIMSTSSKIMSSLVYGLAQTGAIFFLGPVVDIVNGVAVIAIRSILSKSVEPYEIGKLNSIIGICEVIMPLVYVPMYTQVYTATMEFMPGLVFLIGGALTIPALCVFIWLFYRHLRSVKMEKVTSL